eukprot:TRINITY_DN88052_c0_g1_i1.p1 TRINITY_DN88052_c0_g1~~TRINITY_DN88052_c0_g1_i1.p1  ORF type:complete len:246 (+),score=67.99 TRINITY_DN88052_c0_g1_i1:60-797(+)
MGGDLLDAIDAHGDHHDALDAMSAQPVLKTKYTSHGMVTEVQEPTSMIGMVAGGAAAGGAAAFLICTSKCPGHMMGNIASALPFGEIFDKISGNTKKDNDDNIASSEEEPGQQKLYDQMDSIEKILCSMNCKLAGAMGAGAGAAAGYGAQAAGVGQGGGGAGGGLASKFGFYAPPAESAVLDGWAAGPFASIMKQLDDMQKDVDEAEHQVKKKVSSCGVGSASGVAASEERTASSQKMKTLLEFI